MASIDSHTCSTRRSILPRLARLLYEILHYYVEKGSSFTESRIWI